MTNSRQTLGRWGEDLAAKYLAGRGYTIVERNLRTAYGEIDIIARQAEVTVFVEVKTRTSTAYGYPEESITAKKRAHLIASVPAYLQTCPNPETEWRIDVIAIRRQHPSRPPQITHFQNAIGA
jgi:putative endonuclease